MDQTDFQRFVLHYLNFIIGELEGAKKANRSPERLAAVTITQDTMSLLRAKLVEDVRLLPLFDFAVAQYEAQAWWDDLATQPPATFGASVDPLISGLKEFREVIERGFGPEPDGLESA
jgi:hypothetical protein